MAIVVGIVTSPELDLVSDLGDLSFWALAGGAVLLVLGVVFNRI